MPARRLSDWLSTGAWRARRARLARRCTPRRARRASRGPSPTGRWLSATSAQRTPTRCGTSYIFYIE
eukprot:9258628-Pyramimonas_sp.AAC.1